jgi:acylpyruvate hydrolase
MRLVTFNNGLGDRIGAWIDQSIVDLNVLCGFDLEKKGNAHPRDAANQLVPNNMIDFLASGNEGLEAIRNAVSSFDTSESDTCVVDGIECRLTYGIKDVKLKAPIPRPPKIICVGLNYLDHCEESGLDVPESPFFFLKPWTAVIGMNDAIVIPKMTEANNHIDYELELAVVVGRKGKHIPEGDAYDYVAGYTILNDVSARDFQPPEFLPMKGFDTFAPMGPCIALKDQIENVDDLNVQLKVNNEIRQRSNTKNFVFKIPEILSYLSRILTLEPGDVITTGTPGGVGWKRSPPAWLMPGDIVSAEIQNIGILTNPVVAEQ